MDYKANPLANNSNKHHDTLSNQCDAVQNKESPVNTSLNPYNMNTSIDGLEGDDKVMAEQYLAFVRQQTGSDILVPARCHMLNLEALSFIDKNMEFLFKHRYISKRVRGIIALSLIGTRKLQSSRNQTSRQELIGISMKDREFILQHSKGIRNRLKELLADKIKTGEIVDSNWAYEHVYFLPDFGLSISWADSWNHPACIIGSEKDLIATNPAFKNLTVEEAEARIEWMCDKHDNTTKLHDEITRVGSEEEYFQINKQYTSWHKQYCQDNYFLSEGKHECFANRKPESPTVICYYAYRLASFYTHIQIKTPSSHWITFSIPKETDENVIKTEAFHLCEGLVERPVMHQIAWFDEEDFDCSVIPLNSFCKLSNGGQTCYLNSVLQVLFSVSYFRSTVQRIEDSLEGSLAKTFKIMNSNSEQYFPAEIINYMCIDVHIATDAAEFLGKMFDNLRFAPKSIFYFEIKSSVENLSDKDGSTNNELQSNIILSESCNAVQDGIDSYLGVEGRKDDNSVISWNEIIHYPVVLTILINRNLTGRQKIDIDLNISLRGPTYSLFAVIISQILDGSKPDANGEIRIHYYSYIKCNDSNWKIYDDSDIHEVTQEAVIKDSAFNARMLFYYDVERENYIH